MSFAFGFSGDDIEGQDADATAAQVDSLSLDDARPSAPAIQVQRLSLDDMLASLPSHISYYTTLLHSPKHGRRAVIPRRVLFDIRAQIMAEDEGAEGEVTGLGESDIEQNVYEGGFKSWEGATDLALLLLDRGEEYRAGQRQGRDASPRHVVELGCGTALPSLVLLQQTLRSDTPLKVTLADYNASVLRLVTLPNVLLIWALQHQPLAFSPGPPRVEKGDDMLQDEEGDLEISPELLAAFSSWLEDSQIEISFIAGPWQPELVRSINPKMDEDILLLAAETIYSPVSTTAFTKTTLDILRASRLGTALVAAKRVYFGVGGGVVDFEQAVKGLGGKVMACSGTGILVADPELYNGGAGVARWIGEVTVD